MKSKLLAGIIAAPFTPFTPDGRLNLDRIPELAADLRRNGITGAFICGTTGEGCSLTSAERQLVAEAWARAKPEGLALVVHVGHNCLEESAALARHASQIGADAFAMMAPSFLRPAKLEDLVESCAVVAAAAAGLPFYYYHLPEMTGVHFAMRDFLQFAASRIPNLAGVKFSHSDLMDFARARAFDPTRYAVLHGRDEILLAGLALGATGAVGSTYNYAAPVYQRLIQAFKAGDLVNAQREQALAVKFINVMLRHGGLPANKAIMKLVGLDCGGTRLPLRALNAAGEARLKADLEDAGFFEAIRGT